MSCDSFGVASCIQARFVDDLVRWLFPRGKSGANPVLIDFLELRGASFRRYNNFVLVCNLAMRISWQDAVRARRLNLAIGAKDISVLMREKTTAAGEQLELFQISSGATLYVHLDKLGLILKSA